MKKAACMVVVLLIPVFVVLNSVYLAVTSDAFFSRQYEINRVPQNTNIEHAELMRITDEIQVYLLDKRSDFKIFGVINGQYRQIFNEREIMHMEDVHKLFQSGFLIRNIIGILLIILFCYLWKADRNLLFKAVFFSFFCFVCTALLIWALLALDFHRYFVLFHEILFTNDLWILDPQTSILVNMVPMPFFLAIARRILTTSVLILMVLGGIGWTGSKRISAKRQSTGRVS